ncbi:NAD(P)-dependent oxidoreductase [candidate division KSB1 bacterium]|nr:NAD(P)-dependent oxidoreductase [candidate division KSB1 bacterium]
MILLTGATGFFGGHLLSALIKAGRNVVILKRTFSRLDRIRNLIPRTLACYDVETTDIDDIFRKNRIETVIHAAVNYGRAGESITEVLEPNFLLPLRLYKNVCEHGGCFMTMDSFFTKDGRIYPEAVDYCLSKRQLSEWLRYGGAQSVNIRVEHMYGPHDHPSKFIPSVILSLLRGEKFIQLTAGTQQRDFIYVGDVVKSVLVVLENLPKINNGYTEFQIGTGQVTEIRRVVHMIKEIVKNQSTSLDFGALPMSPDEITRSCADNQDIVSLGWRPQVDLQTGLLKTVQFYRQN